jgi:hypothetical protein
MSAAELATCLAACVALALAPLHTRAAPPGDALPTVEDADPAVQEAEALYESGLADYETFEYDGAIQKWTEAYQKLSGAPGTAQMRNAIVYNIARAREKAYEQSGDPSHLKKAKSLLERYIADEEASGAADPEDLAKARAQVQALADRIATIEREKKAATTPTRAPKDDVEKPRAGRGLIVAGAVSTALGAGLVVGGVTAGAVLGRRADRDVPKLDELGDEAERRDRIADGKRANLVMIACGVAGGVVALTGVALLSVGLAKRKKAERASASVSPALGPGFAGAAIRGRF